LSCFLPGSKVTIFFSFLSRPVVAALLQDLSPPLLEAYEKRVLSPLRRLKGGQACPFPVSPFFPPNSQREVNGKRFLMNPFPPPPPLIPGVLLFFPPPLYRGTTDLLSWIRFSSLPIELLPPLMARADGCRPSFFFFPTPFFYLDNKKIPPPPPFFPYRLVFTGLLFPTLPLLLFPLSKGYAKRKASPPLAFFPFFSSSDSVRTKGQNHNDVCFFLPPPPFLPVSLFSFPHFSKCISSLVRVTAKDGFFLRYTFLLFSLIPK